MKTLINVGGQQKCYGAGREIGGERERRTGGRRAGVCQGAYMHPGTMISKNGTLVTQYHREKTRIGRIGMLGADEE